ncbi:MAG: hypothetical protein V7767_13700, partial [Leeuwenhoekiella sp.]
HVNKEESQTAITIEAPSGNFQLPNREYTLHIHSVLKPKSILVDGSERILGATLNATDATFAENIVSINILAKEKTGSKVVLKY